MQRLKEEEEDSWIDEEMEGEEAGYLMKMDEVENGFSRPTRVGLRGGKVENEVDKAAFERATRATLGNMSRKQHLETCYQLWRRLWLQQCSILWNKIQHNLPLRRFSAWDKGLWKLMSVVWPDQWVPMPGRKHELATAKEIRAADLEWPRDRAFRTLARDLVGEFLNGRPSKDFMKLIDRLDKRFGGFYTTSF
jgi:hypothetical protein